MPLGKKASSYRVVYRVPLLKLSVCLSVCVTFVLFTDCESCTRPIFHKPGIYGSGRACANAWDVVFRAPSRGGRGRWADVGFVVCFRWGGFFLLFFFFDSFLFERTRPAASMRPPCLIYLSTSTGVRTGCHYLISLFMCMCNIRGFY